MPLDYQPKRDRGVAWSPDGSADLFGRMGGMSRLLLLVVLGFLASLLQRRADRNTNAYPYGHAYRNVVQCRTKTSAESGSKCNPYADHGAWLCVVLLVVRLWIHFFSSLLNAVLLSPVPRFRASTANQPVQFCARPAP
jgi:hypothetical protein